MLTRLITKIAIYVIPILLDAVCIGVKRWMRSQAYKQLEDRDRRRY